MNIEKLRVQGFRFTDLEIDLSSCQARSWYC